MNKIILFALLFFSINTLCAQQTSSFQLFFKTDSFSVSDLEQNKLKDFMKRFDTVTVLQTSIKGYCDDVGSTEYNQELSKKRALYTAHLMTELKAEKEGMGEIALTNSQDIDKQRKLNRRADITVFYSLIEKPKQQPVVTTETVVTKKVNVISDNQKVGDKITLENILFIGGRHALLPESYDDLDILTNSLLQNTKYHICILGHICCIRSGQDGVDYDTGIQNLSVARARIIYDYLISKGINANRLSYKGLRANYPTGRGDKEDRRVEIEITKIVE